MPEEVKQYRDQLEGRTMLVKKAKVIPLEAIVRGYLTGSFSCHFLIGVTHGLYPYPLAIRFWVGGVQEIRDRAQDTLARGPRRISETTSTTVHTVNESRTRTA